MFFWGIVLLAAAIATFWLARAPGDVSKFRRQSIEQFLSLGIVAAGMVGLAMTLIGIGRL
jgi:hypothetical protein